MTPAPWLLWCVVAALALPALFSSLAPADGGRLLRLARNWSPALVAVVVALVVTVDTRTVTEEELYVASDRAAASLSGTLDSVGQQRLAVAVEEDLGHEVWVEPVAVEAAADAEDRELYEVEDAPGPGRGGDGDGPAVCIEVTQTPIGVDQGLEVSSLRAVHGRCDAG